MSAVAWWLALDNQRLLILTVRVAVLSVLLLALSLGLSFFYM
jgi:hypothetical protein